MEMKYARDFIEHPKSKIVKEWFEDGIDIVILVCKGSHFTAYFGIPKNHPLAGFNYDDIPLDVHGGLTYGSSDSKVLPKDYFFYGWDYAHLGDRTFYDIPERIFLEEKSGEHDWTIDEVEKEVRGALYDFKKIVKLAERIALK